MTTARETRLRSALRPLESDEDLDALLESVRDARCVLLGEASHGTHEYYVWRDRISRRLIAEKGFSFIAVEGDWPDCYQVNRFIKGRHDEAQSPEEALGVFERWPTWMWANREVVDLCAWLRQHNDERPPDARVGFYGLDVYSLWASLTRILQHLERLDADAAATAREAFRCFDLYGTDPRAYARSTVLVPASCEEQVVRLLSAVLERRQTPGEDPEDRFSVEQDARAMVGAERYYRTMVQGNRTSWNVRDTHMVDTLDRLLELHGPDSKAIVWAHNTHIGDARATPMTRFGMHNVGQLVRERHGDDGVFIVGFAGHRGGVIAGSEWGAPMERMPVPEAKRGSIEDLLHNAAERDGLLLLSDAHDELGEPVDHRAIGVVYEPTSEPFTNYVPSLLPLRYDALVHLEETHALAPLGFRPRPEPEPPETYPTGV